MGPFAADGSTIWPFCVITMLPAATRRRAAARAGSISDSHSWRASLPPTSFAASDGQIVLSRPRSARSSRIAASNAGPVSDGLSPRQASLQYFTASQSRSHFLRHEKARPHRLHILSLCGVSRSGLCFLSGMVLQMPKFSPTSLSSCLQSWVPHISILRCGVLPSPKDSRSSRRPRYNSGW